MPVEAFVETASRTVLAYLTKPIVDQIAHAWKET
jgi:HlyD family secretion protein